MLLTFSFASAFLLTHSTDIRTLLRWLLWSREYKRQVMGQSDWTGGDFKHIEWDGWGWGGSDISVFLVFDPNDSLAGATKTQESGRFNGIPCDVSVVRQLARHWYTVQFDGYVKWNASGHCT
jgi:hypothetical protein